MPIKGRNNCKDKQAEQIADDILQSDKWQITAETPFSVVEQLLFMICVSRPRPACPPPMIHTTPLSSWVFDRCCMSGGATETTE